MGLLGDIGEFIFGRGDETKVIPPDQLIAKPTVEEQQLFHALLPAMYGRLSLVYGYPPQSRGDANIGSQLGTALRQAIGGRIKIGAQVQPQSRGGGVRWQRVRGRGGVFNVGQLLNIGSRIGQQAQQAGLGGHRVLQTTQQPAGMPPKYSLIGVSLFDRYLPAVETELNRYYQATKGLLPVLRQSLAQTQAVSRGELPASFRQAIERSFREELGGLLNQAAARGIINSSVTQQAIANALQRTADMRARYLQQAASLAQTPLRTALAGMSLLEAPVQARYRLLGLAETPLKFEDRLMLRPYETWLKLMSARHRVPGQVVVERGSGGLLGAIGGGLGAGLGMGLGSRLIGG